MRTVLITDLHIKKDPNHSYAPYDSGSAKGCIRQKILTGAYYVGAVWPGESVFPGFHVGAARDWWGGQYKDFTAWASRVSGTT